MKTTAHLKIDHLFDAVFDIAAGDFIPKPDERTYLRFLDRFGIDPAKAAMFEDIPRNLEVPYQLGMTTVLVAPRAGHDERDGWEDECRGAAFVDFRHKHILHCYRALMEQLSARDIRWVPCGVRPLIPPFRSGGDRVIHTIRNNTIEVHRCAVRCRCKSCGLCKFWLLPR